MCTAEGLRELDLAIEMIRGDLETIKSGKYVVLDYGEDVTDDWIARINFVARRLEWIVESHRSENA